jgi:putative membrane protein
MLLRVDRALVALAVGLAGALYARGAARLWLRRGGRRAVPGARAGAFAAGLAVVGAALLSPLDGWAARSFALHMLQHVLLVAVAAPLLVLGEPLVPWLWALPGERRRRVGAWWRSSVELRGVWRAASAPVVAWALALGALWVWHAPALYEGALRSAPVHAIEHGSFLGTGLLFWWPVVRGSRLAPPGALLYLFAAAIASSALGALIAFSGTVWYGSYAAPSPLGLTPLEDQAAAGLLMWVGGGAIYLVAMLAVLLVWLRPGAVAEASARPSG